jgi:hypothetical protein
MKKKRSSNVGSSRRSRLGRHQPQFALAAAASSSPLLVEEKEVAARALPAEGRSSILQQQEITAVVFSKYFLQKKTKKCHNFLNLTGKIKP